VAHATEPVEDESFDFGDEDESFDFGDEDADSAAATTEPPSDWRFSLAGFARSDSAVWAERFDTNPLAKARQSVDLTAGVSWRFLKLDVALHAEYDFAYLHERESYDAATLETYEWLLNTREVQLAASLGDFEITVGRQIIAWGEGDMLSPLDVVNPRDMREPGQSDLADMRLPVLATRVGWFTGAHRLELMIVHESDFGYRSPPRGPYSGLEAMMSSGLLGEMDVGAMVADTELVNRHVQPRFALDQQEVYLRWVYKGEGVDLGAYFASFLDPQGVISLDKDGMLDAMLGTSESSTMTLGFDHQRYHMLGVSGAWPHRSFLFKWEVSLDVRRPVGVLVDDQLVLASEIAIPVQLPGSAPAEVVNLMAGVTWTGVEHLIVGVEFMKPTLVDDPDRMLMDMNALTFSLRASYQALDDRLTISAVALFFGWYRQQGWLVRGDVTYDLLDTLQIGLGYISYQPGSEFGALFGLERHDRLFANVRWDFQVL